MYYYTIRTYSSYVVTRVANVVVSRRVVSSVPIEVADLPQRVRRDGRDGGDELAARVGSPGQVHDQRAVSDAGDAPGQRRVRRA